MRVSILVSSAWAMRFKAFTEPVLRPLSSFIVKSRESLILSYQSQKDPRMKPLRLLMLLLIPLVDATQAFGADEPVPCADRSIVAGALRAPEDVEAFVQCAYEFVQEMGFEEAHRAFHEDERWRSGPIYVVVTEVAPMPETARLFVFPPAPSMEGSPGGRVDVFGNHYVVELRRILKRFNRGWFYFGLDTNGSPLFSGNPYSQSWWGGLTPELTDHMDGPFEGRDVVSVGDAFGETFLYYSTHNPRAGTMQGKVAFVKRVVVSGLPILIGSGYYGEPAPVSVGRPDGTAPAPSQAGRVVVAGTDATFGNDDYVLNSATITGDTLAVSVSYSGGCREHVFTLVIAASFVDSSPVRLPAVLRHDANGDTCEAFPTESYAFDLALVRARYQEVYGPGAGRVALEIDGVPEDGLVYEFTE